MWKIISYALGLALPRGGEGGLCRQDGPPNGQGWKVIDKAVFVHGSPPAPLVGFHFKRDHVCICLHFYIRRQTAPSNIASQASVPCRNMAENIQTSQYSQRGHGETSLGKRLSSKEEKKKRDRQGLLFETDADQKGSSPRPCPGFSTRPLDLRLICKGRAEKDNKKKINRKSESTGNKCLRAWLRVQEPTGACSSKLLRDTSAGLRS